MAYGAFFSVATTGNNGLEARVYVDITDDAANNRSSIDAELQMRKTNGFASTGSMSGTFTIEGSGVTVSGTKTVGTSWTTIAVAGRRYYSHNTAGVIPDAKTVSVNSVAMSGSSDYDTPVSGSKNFGNGTGFTDYVRVPTTPPQASAATGVTSNSATLAWGASTFYGSGPDYAFYLSKVADFASLVTSGWQGNVRSKSYTGLERGTTYYHRNRAKDSEGTSGYSTARSFTTLHTVPDKPTLSLISASTTSIALSSSASSATRTRSSGTPCSSSSWRRTRTSRSARARSSSSWAAKSSRT